MLGTGEPCAKKAKYDLQRKYNERRKEKPRKPQFSLNFQFNFGEEGEMRETNEIAPCKGIQDSLGFWIPCCGFRIPGTGFRIPAQWIPDSKKSWIPFFYRF